MAGDRERKTLRQVSVAVMNGETPPPAIDDEQAKAARARARAFLAEAAEAMQRIDRES